MPPPRRIDDLLAALVLEDEAGICDAVEGDEECLLLLAEVFERSEEWIGSSPSFTNRLLRGCISVNAELPHRCTSRAVPERVRVRFVESMRPLLLAVCASEPVREAVREPVFLWWDCFAIGDRVGQGGPAVSVLYEGFPAETRLIADVQLRILTSLLWADQRLGCESALHGLNHLLHPNSADTVASFLAQRREWLIGEDLLDYAIRCRDAAAL